MAWAIVLAVRVEIAWVTVASQTAPEVEIGTPSEVGLGASMVATLGPVVAGELPALEVREVAVVGGVVAAEDSPYYTEKTNEIPISD